jgi:putative hydrolase of the HAD superfamily
MTKTSGTVITGVRAVFFDLDDTLYDRRSSQQQTLRLIVEDFHDLLGQVREDILFQAFLDSDAESMQDFNSGASIEASRLSRSRRFLAKLQLDARFAEGITASYLNHYPSFQTPVEGAQAVVRRLADRFPLGIISNGSPRVQYQKLDRLGLTHMFRCVMLSEEIGIRKPDPAIFVRAVDALNMVPGECVHVGDSHETDVAGARGAGVRACWFNPRSIKLRAGDVKPDAEIRALIELSTVLDASPC